MKNLSLTLSRNCLLTIYKTFIKSVLDYVDIIYDKTFTVSFKDKLEMVQYNVAIVRAGAIRCTSLEVFTENSV